MYTHDICCLFHQCKLIACLCFKNVCLHVLGVVGVTISSHTNECEVADGMAPAWLQSNGSYHMTPSDNPVSMPDEDDLWPLLLTLTTSQRMLTNLLSQFLQTCVIFVLA